jgi:hypothetical protein
MRLLLCMPRGCGFNDAMCQIWQSFHYAVHTKRELLIDTRFCGLADDLSDYFQIAATAMMQRVPTQIDINKVDWQSFNQLTCYPPVFEGSLDLIGHCFLATSSASSDDFDPRLLSRISRMLRYLRQPFFELSPKQKWRILWLRFRLIKQNPNLHCTDDRHESLVIHHRSGGGLDSLKALSMFQLKTSIRDNIIDRLQLLGQDYDAVHFRHTDYKTDYESLINSLQHKLVGRKVLLCSDNPKVIEYAKSRLTASEVVCVAPLDALSPDIDAFRPAHYQWHLPLSERRQRNITMLTDLIGMARAKNLYFGDVTRTEVLPPSFLHKLRRLILPPKVSSDDALTYVGSSGFAVLASALSKQPAILDRFVG